MDEIKPTPRNKLLGLIADNLREGLDFATYNGQNKPMSMLAELLALPAIQKTADRLSYGEPLTTGKGFTTRLQPETFDAAMGVLPFAGSMGRGANYAAEGLNKGAAMIGKAAAPSTERLVNAVMAKGGLPAQLMQDMAQGTKSPAIVWHGSPHKFAPTPNNPLGEFDFSKIGTGEGAQAYGHGGYMGGAKQTGQTYMGADGYLYKVDLPDEHIAKMLSMESPIEQVPQAVQDYYKRQGAYKEGRPLNEHMAIDQFAAKEFSQAGIPGIKYLDGGSRINGSFKITPPDQTVSGKWMVKGDDYNSKGLHFDSEAEALAKMQEMNNSATRNYVIFPGNERLLKILERNGESVAPKFPQSEALDLAQQRAALPISENGLGLPANNTAMDRARAMDWNQPAYTGVNTIGEIDNMLPKSWFSEQPKYASDYANVLPKTGIEGDPRVYPVLLNTGKVNSQKYTGLYDDMEKALSKKKTDTFKVENVGGGENNFYVTKDPNQIRSRFAAFDPWRRNAAIAASMGVAAPDLLANPLDDKNNRLIDILRSK